MLPVRGILIVNERSGDIPKVPCVAKTQCDLFNDVSNGDVPKVNARSKSSVTFPGIFPK